MGTSIVQANFTSGEIAPSLYGRVDFARYYSGLRTCRNMIVRPSGGITNRGGTRMCSPFKDSTKSGRLIEFEFNTTQAYVLEFTAGKIRVYMDGGIIVDPGTGLPVEITTLYNELDLFMLKFVQSADVLTITHPSYPQQQLSRLSHTSWTFAPFNNVGGPFLDINTNASLTVHTDGILGSVTVTSNADIFKSNMVGQMLYLEQNPDYTVPKWEVQIPITMNSQVRAGTNYYQAVNTGTTGTVRPDHLEGTAYDGSPGVGWKYIHSGSGIVLITGFTSAKGVTGTVLTQLPQSLVTASFTKAITAAAVVGDGSTVYVTCPGHGFASGDSITISSVLGMTDLNGTWALNQGSDLFGLGFAWDADHFFVKVTTAQVYLSGGSAVKTALATPAYKWALEAWGGDSGYPGVTAYFDQRQIFARSNGKPQSYWMSKVEDFLDFGKSNPILDDDAIAYTLNARKVNEVRHFVELSQLIMLTSDGPFLISGDSTGLIAPGKMGAKRQSASGASDIPPLIVDTYALYVQTKGSQVRSLGYSWQADSGQGGFTGEDLTIISNHLFKNRRIVDWAFQEVPFSCAWVVLDNGALLALTYLPKQEVVGWHRHDTDGFVESVACIPENNEDVIYLLVRRHVNGQDVRFVERMDTRAYATLADAFFVDCGLSYDGRNTFATTMMLSGGVTWDYTEQLTLAASSTNGVNGGTGFGPGDIGDQIVFVDYDQLISYRFTIQSVTNPTHAVVSPNRLIPDAYHGAPRSDWQFAHNQFTGLDHLEGKTVSILSDGMDEAPQVVIGGAVTLSRPGAVVHIGLPIIAEMETLDIASNQQEIRSKEKTINHVSLILEDTVGVKVGPDADNLDEIKQRDQENYDANLAPFTGIIDQRVPTNWNKKGRILVRQDRPLPITVLACIPEVALGGS